MQVILLERVEKLGQMGEEVKVKNGFARNFLLPQKKALRATKANREFFLTQKSQLEARNLERKGEAEKVGKTLEGKVFALLRQAGDRGQLYGSVSPRDIADAITAGGFSVNRGQVPLDQAIRAFGAANIYPLRFFGGDLGVSLGNCLAFGSSGSLSAPNLRKAASAARVPDSQAPPTVPQSVS